MKGRREEVAWQGPIRTSLDYPCNAFSQSMRKASMPISTPAIMSLPDNAPTEATCLAWVSKEPFLIPAQNDLEKPAQGQKDLSPGSIREQGLPEPSSGPRLFERFGDSFPTLLGAGEVGEVKWLSVS